METQLRILFRLGSKIQIAFHPVPLQLCQATCYIPPPPTHRHTHFGLELTTLRSKPETLNQEATQVPLNLLHF